MVFADGGLFFHLTAKEAIGAARAKE